MEPDMIEDVVDNEVVEFTEIDLLRDMNDGIDSWKVKEDFIDYLISMTQEDIWEPFPGITIMAWCLPNGYTIVESSGTIDPAEYDVELGKKYCREALKRKLWQLEGYMRKENFWTWNALMAQHEAELANSEEDDLTN